MIRWNYDSLKNILSSETLPAMVVNMDAIDFNLDIIEKYALSFNKKIRIATKSIRVPDIALYILKKNPKVFQGLMCFSIFEAKFYFEKGITDLLIGYPVVQYQELVVLSELINQGADIKIMLDHPDQFKIIEDHWNKNGLKTKVKICLDIDCSFQFFGIYAGVYRSSIKNLNSLKERLNLIKQSNYLNFNGLMAYEAQVAGLPDRNPYQSFLNFIKRWIRKKSMRLLAVKRAEIKKIVEENGFHLSFFNGGGSGSLQMTLLEEAISEVTVGSGIFQAQLFDYYTTNEFSPAIAFALTITRNSDPHILTCQSGGFIASGMTSRDKTPKPFMPEGVELIEAEGMGEVQSPIKISDNCKLKIGDMVFFRPAKSGEIAERFNEYLLIRNNKIEKKVLTYRGLNLNFF
ncbi:MAG: alanine racemase [Bacteriovoracaceae bacterium]